MTTTASSDAELLAQARRGDETAFAELYVRHEAAARRLANSYARAGDPDDLVNEAFERVLKALRKGLGPDEAFRAYLFVTLRRLAADRIARRQDDPYDEVPEPVRAAAHGPDIDAADRALVVQAYESLPDRWQAVLWQTAVEGAQPRELAPALGMSANAAAALAYRAREKLRQAYLQAHLQTAPRPACEPHRSRLGAYVRDGLGTRDRSATGAHIDECSSCQGLVAELADVNRLLVRSLFPIFVAAGEAAAALAAATTAVTALGTGAGAGVGGALRGAADIPRRTWSRARSNPTGAGVVVGAILLAAMIAGALVVARDDPSAEPGPSRGGTDAAAPAEPGDSPPSDNPPAPPPFAVPPGVTVPPAPDGAPTTIPEDPPLTAAPSPSVPPRAAPGTPPSSRGVPPDTEPPGPPPEEPEPPPTEPPPPTPTRPPTSPPQPPPPAEPSLAVVWLQASAELRITLRNPGPEPTDFLSLKVEARGGAVVNGVPSGCNVAVALVWTASCGLAPVDPGDAATVTVRLRVSGPGQSSRVAMCDGGLLSLSCVGSLLGDVVTALL
jgi:RNA polymerase sigma factor (sigma-70 family)